MKRFLSFFLAIATIFTLCACAKEESESIQKAPREITWESSPEVCMEKMKLLYNIPTDDIEYEPEYKGKVSLCEFNFFGDIQFENFAEAELEFYFDETQKPFMICVYDFGSDVMQVENVLALARKYLGEETQSKVAYQNEHANGYATLYYWNDGNTGAYIHVGINGGPYVTFVNLNSEFGKEQFQKSVELVKMN